MSENRDMSGTHDCGGDAAAYVLGALEPAEAAAFRQHLEGCAVCRDELEAFDGVVQALPMAAPQYAAPRHLRRRVMRAVRAEQAAGARRARSLPLFGRSLGPRAALAGLAAAAVVAIAIVAGGTGGGARVIQARVSGVSGTAELRVSGGQGELIVHRLSPPPVHEVYEVWLAAPHTAPSPAGVLFSVTSSGHADLVIPRNLRGISRVMVTAEPDGGSPAPTHTPVIVAPLT